MDGDQSEKAVAREFSKSIHDYYTHYTDNADAKIGAMFGINAAVAGILLGNLPDTCLARSLTWVAVGLSALAAVVLLYGIYPRTGRGGSLIYWERVRQAESAEVHAQEVAELSPDEVERAYAVNNYYVADVLHRKFQAIQIAIWLTGGALTSAIASVIAAQ